MFETFTYDSSDVLPLEARNHWEFMETNSAAAVLKAVCPEEWKNVVDILSKYRL